MPTPGTEPRSSLNLPPSSPPSLWPWPCSVWQLPGALCEVPWSRAGWAPGVLVVWLLTQPLSLSSSRGENKRESLSEGIEVRLLRWGVGVEAKLLR